MGEDGMDEEDEWELRMVAVVCEGGKREIGHLYGYVWNLQRGGGEGDGDWNSVLYSLLFYTQVLNFLSYNS